MLSDTLSLSSYSILTSLWQYLPTRDLGRLAQVQKEIARILQNIVPAWKRMSSGLEFLPTQIEKERWGSHIRLISFIDELIVIHRPKNSRSDEVVAWDGRTIQHILKKPSHTAFLRINHICAGSNILVIQNHQHIKQGRCNYHKYGIQYYNIQKTKITQFSEISSLDSVPKAVSANCKNLSAFLDHDSLTLTRFYHAHTKISSDTIRFDISTPNPGFTKLFGNSHGILAVANQSLYSLSHSVTLESICIQLVHKSSEPIIAAALGNGLCAVADIKNRVKIYTHNRYSKLTLIFSREIQLVHGEIKKMFFHGTLFVVQQKQRAVFYPNFKVNASSFALRCTSLAILAPDRLFITNGSKIQQCRLRNGTKSAKSG